MLWSVRWCICEMDQGRSCSRANTAIVWMAIRDGLSSVGWYLLCSTHLPNLYTITCNEEIKGNAKWKNSRFEPPFRDIGVTHRVHLARWKAHCRLTISDNWTFFASSHGCGTIKQNVSKSAFSGVGHFERKF